MAASFYWHDYETFGIDPQRDRACQFAGIRTDFDFNPIGEPLMIYCRLPEDCLPDPLACLITGITPQQVANGLLEAEFVAEIHRQLATPDTCSVGYNNIRFDDEVTRNLLYRNLYDPYAREWQHRNSRWDLIDLVRACHALRPDGIVWPRNADGIVSLKLEHLTAANGIQHQQAHDALSDVYATIAMARLIKQRQPRLYEFIFEHRHKTKVLELLNVGSNKPLIHISGRYPNQRHNLAIVLPLGFHPRNDKEVIVYDLAVDPQALLTLDAEQIRRRLFTASHDLPVGSDRIALKTLHTNKCPVLAPLSVLSAQDCERLGVDLSQCRRHLDALKTTATDLMGKLRDVYAQPYQTDVQDPELMLYSGGFLSNHDRQLLEHLRQLPATALAAEQPLFQDERLDILWFRYKARNWPQSLDPTQHQQWRQFCYAKLHGGKPSAWERFQMTIHELQAEWGEQHPVLLALQQFARQRAPEFYDAVEEPF